jgi:ABC-type amino acid transport substrate-binding protein
MANPTFARQIEVASDYATNLRKLIHGRIDGILADDVTVVMAAAKALGLHERLEKHPLAISGNVSHLLFSKRSVDPALVAAVNARLAAMKSDGRLQRILDQYADEVRQWPTPPGTTP